MKTFIMCILLIAVSPLYGNTLTTKDGKIFKGVIIVSADPERMLIVYDGGGEQVAYSDLTEGALSSEMKAEIQMHLKEYAERQARLEEMKVAAEIARIEKEAFERAQIEKGLIKFEGAWMTPQDRQDILAGRELDRMEQERLVLELEKEKAKLREAELRAEQARLAAYEQPRTVVYTRYYPSYRSNYKCRTTQYPHRKSYRRSSGLHVSYSSGGNSFSYRSGAPAYPRQSLPGTVCKTRR